MTLEASFTILMFKTQATVANVTTLFAVVIYYHFMVLLSFCVIKQHYDNNNHWIAVNYRSKKFYNIGQWSLYYKTFYGRYLQVLQ